MPAVNTIKVQSVSTLNNFEIKISNINVPIVIMLKNAKMFGGDPSTNVRLSSVTGGGTQDAYGFAGFDGNDGIITIRNSAQSAKTVTMKFDRTIGVPEDAGTLQYHIEHSYNKTCIFNFSTKCKYFCSFGFFCTH